MAPAARAAGGWWEGARQGWRGWGLRLQAEGGDAGAGPCAHPPRLPFLSFLPRTSWGPRFRMRKLPLTPEASCPRGLALLQWGTTWPLPAAAGPTQNNRGRSFLSGTGRWPPPSAGPWRRRGRLGWEREVLVSRLWGGRGSGGGGGGGAAWPKESSPWTGPSQVTAPTLTFRDPKTKAGCSRRCARGDPAATVIGEITN